MNKRCAVIVAGGQGIRMQGVLPKQFLEVNGLPVLMHTINRFNIPGIELILVLKDDYHQYWKDQCKALNFDVPHRLVAGGNTRADSVLNGIKDLHADSFVAVHDAVRPILTEAFIQRLFAAAEKFGTAVPVVPVKYTLRHVTDDASITVPRDEFVMVQTPQVFNSGLLQKAFMTEGYDRYTDEASLYEASGNGPVHLETGEENNIKLTVPADLILAGILLKE